MCECESERWQLALVTYFSLDDDAEAVTCEHCKRVFEPFEKLTSAQFSKRAAEVKLQKENDHFEQKPDVQFVLGVATLSFYAIVFINSLF